uniref:ABC transporter permease subunit n=1 Tax=Conchiformibius kuhniae TaxID=211502 RepID=A0A8T9MYN2_9NEIS|nr:ABC transporter permease subunit [Conchiformibius kuhniae]
MPNLRNGFGLTLVMSLTFYPYVYLLARNAFAGMGQRALEAGASLGLSPWRAFFKIALPMARPWIAGGAVLALMETLADFGTVSVFGYETFTTAIYETWFGMFSLDTAKQLAAILITAVFVLLVLEQFSRGARRFHRNDKSRTLSRRPLQARLKWAATAYCGVVLLLAFALPVLQLGWWAYETWAEVFNERLWEQAWHSFAGGMAAALLTAAAAVLLALAKRADGSRFAAVCSRVATLGYAVPGTVLAVGVFVPVAALDNFLLAHFGFPEGTTAVFKGTLAVMLLAYLIRFLAVAYASAEAGLERISPSQGEAWRGRWAARLGACCGGCICPCCAGRGQRRC